MTVQHFGWYIRGKIATLFPIYLLEFMGSLAERIYPEQIPQALCAYRNTFTMDDPEGLLVHTPVVLKYMQAQNLMVASMRFIPEPPSSYKQPPSLGIVCKQSTLAVARAAVHPSSSIHIIVPVHDLPARNGSDANLVEFLSLFRTLASTSGQSREKAKGIAFLVWVAELEYSFPFFSPHRHDLSTVITFITDISFHLHSSPLR